MGKSGKIYLVDDDASARKGLARLLNAAGYEVSVFASPEKFLNANIEREMSCLLLDARMPGLSGNALQAHLVARGINLPVIFVTADDNREIREKARECNVAGFFHKPIDGPALLDAIAWVLETHRKEKKNT